MTESGIEQTPSVEVSESTLEEIMGVNDSIPEFADDSRSLADFTERLGSSEKLVLVAKVNNVPVGYMVSYVRPDGSLYCWMTGVVPEARNHGALSSMMKKLEEYAHHRGFESIYIKTRNTRRQMLSFLVKNGWMIESVEKHDEDIENNRISFVKQLS